MDAAFLSCGLTVVATGDLGRWAQPVAPYLPEHRVSQSSVSPRAAPLLVAGAEQRSAAAQTALEFRIRTLGGLFFRLHFGLLLAGPI